MNCPNCGVVVKEGKFCNYCGAKLPDDTKRVEVNINKKIEDVAEIKRADYETEESKLKQRQMKAEFIARKVRRWACLCILGLCIALSIIYLFNRTGPANNIPTVLTFLIVFGLIGLPFIIGYIIYLLLKGKW